MEPERAPDVELPAEDLDPFQILGVGIEADDREVRKAYAQQLRATRASGDRVREEEVQRAFEAIRDAEPRRRLAAVAAHREEVRSLIRQGEAKLAEEKPLEALSFFLKVLELAPDFVPVLIMVAAIEHQLGNHFPAIQRTEQVIQLCPESPGPRRHLARLLLLRVKEDSFLSEDEKRELKLRALQALRQARELGSTKSEDLSLESALLNESGQTAELGELVKGCTASLTELRGPADLSLFLNWIAAEAGSDNPPGLQTALRRLESLIPHRAELHEMVAVQLAQLGSEVLDRGPLKRALEIVSAAYRLAPDHLEIRDLHRACQNALENLRSASRAPAGTKLASNFGILKFAFWIMILLAILRGVYSASRNPPPPIPQSRFYPSSLDPDRGPPPSPTIPGLRPSRGSRP